MPRGQFFRDQIEIEGVFVQCFVESVSKGMLQSYSAMLQDVIEISATQIWQLILMIRLE